MKAKDILRLIDAASTREYKAGYEFGLKQSTDDFTRNLQSAVDVGNQTAKELEQARGSIKRLLADCADANQKRVDAMENADDWRKRAESRAEEADALRAEVERLSATDRECVFPCFRLQQAEFRASSLESDVLAAQRDVARLTAERDAARDDLEEEQLCSKSLCGDINQLVDDRDRLTADSTDLTRLLVEARQERDRLGAELSTLRPDYCDTDDVARMLRAEDAERERLVKLGRSIETVLSQKDCSLSYRSNPGLWHVFGFGYLPSRKTAQEAIDTAAGIGVVPAAADKAGEG